MNGRDVMSATINSICHGKYHRRSSTKLRETTEAMNISKEPVCRDIESRFSQCCPLCQGCSRYTKRVPMNISNLFCWCSLNEAQHLMLFIRKR
ncbi:hypothetical protein NPIL_566601 [Nephila pilipes]|uniref:Uncharacterized protein n=1 Tax=Nephila pilipes TaxID=299642 RepID=A0A8X6TAC7_NEPPI|nr:hypothetical protein NPIL_566601 [Nephila pilipes]